MICSSVARGQHAVGSSGVTLEEHRDPGEEGGRTAERALQAQVGDRLLGVGAHAIDAAPAQARVHHRDPRREHAPIRSEAPQVSGRRRVGEEA